MKYKNATKGVLRFRAHDKNGKKKVFELKPGQNMESDRKVDFVGLEQVGDNDDFKKKKKKGD